MRRSIVAGCIANHTSPLSKRIVADWFSTTRWYTQLAGGLSLRQILDGYTHR